MKNEPAQLLKPTRIPDRAVATIHTIALSVALVLSSGCSSPPKDMRWHMVDEGSFTLEIPTSLHKQKVQPIDSHCGEYRSKRMRLDFDEVYGLGYTPEKAKARHDEFARAFETSPKEETGRQFIRRVGERYAHFTVGRDNKWVEWGYPGEYAVEVFIPDVRGGYLSLRVTYRDPADTATALRIAKSVSCKR